MYVKNVRIRNYRSIYDFGELHFEPGFNLLVGANNAGKSSLPACIACKITAEPHRTLRTVPHRHDPLDQVTRLDFSVAASGAETRRLLLNSDRQHFLPWPADTPFDDAHRDAVLHRVFTAPDISFHGSFEVGANSREGKLDKYPATRLYEPLVQQDLRMLQQPRAAAKRDLRAGRVPEPSAPQAARFFHVPRGESTGRDPKLIESGSIRSCPTSRAATP